MGTGRASLWGEPFRPGRQAFSLPDIDGTCCLAVDPGPLEAELFGNALDKEKP